VREDFDYTCECGYYECQECGIPWYPMEISDDSDRKPRCPDCGGECLFKMGS